MNEKIVIEIQYNIDDYVRGFVFIQNRGFFYKHDYLITFALSFTIFIVFYWLVIRKGEDSLNFNDALTLIFGVIITIPVTYALKDFKPFSENRVAKQYKSSPLLQEAQTIYFGEDGIQSKSDSSEGKINWNAIIETAETDKDFFFFTSPEMALFIPKRVFSVEQQDKVKNLAKIKLGDKAKF
jgi:hypothetical protein